MPGLPRLQAEAAERAARDEAQFGQTGAMLRRAMREARQERRDEREFDARFRLKMDQIDTLHRRNEETLKRLDEKIG
jgi:hypothetical protein